MELAQLVQDCKKQKHFAQKAFYERYSGAMQSMCFRYLSDQGLAEAALMAGFLKFFQSIGSFTFENEAKLITWLKKIIVNECLMELRKKKALKFDDIESLDEKHFINSVALSSFDMAVIMNAIGLLPVGFKTVFNMYVLEGYSHKEIAILLGISEGTSKSQLNRAKVMLRKHLLNVGIDNERY